MKKVSKKMNSKSGELLPVDSYRSTESVKLQKAHEEHLRNLENLSDETKQIFHFFADANRHDSLTEPFTGEIAYHNFMMEQIRDKLCLEIDKLKTKGELDKADLLLYHSATKLEDFDKVKSVAQTLLDWSRTVVELNDTFKTKVKTCTNLNVELKDLEKRLEAYPDDMHFPDVEKPAEVKPKKKKTKQSTKTKKTKKISGKKKLKIVVDTE